MHWKISCNWKKILEKFFFSLFFFLFSSVDKRNYFVKIVELLKIFAKIFHLLQNFLPDVIFLLGFFFVFVSFSFILNFFGIRKRKMKGKGKILNQKTERKDFLNDKEKEKKGKKNFLSTLIIFIKQIFINYKIFFLLIFLFHINAKWLILQKRKKIELTDLNFKPY